MSSAVLPTALSSAAEALRRAAYAGQCIADRAEIALATRVATAQLNRRAHPWVSGRRAPPHRQLRRRFLYSF